MLLLLPLRFFRIFFFGVLTFYSYQVSGQIQYINFRHYSLSDGLSSYKVVKVLQDRFGFMWIATQDGLNRFDGKDIIIYNKSSREKHLLLGSDITDMVEDSAQNILWVTTSLGGLNGIDLKTGILKYAFSSVTDSAKRFPDPWLRTIIKNEDDLWIGTNNGITIYNIKDRRFKEPGKVSLQKSNLHYDINVFFKDEFGRIWAFSGFGLVLYSGDDYSVISSYGLADLKLPEGDIYKRFNSCISITSGQVLLATHKGIRRINYDKTGITRINGEIIQGTNNKEVRSLDLDQNRNLWFATDKGLYKMNIVNGIISTVEDVNRVDQKKWTHSINNIFFDKYNNLWLGTLQGFAIATKTYSPFLNFFQSADLKTKITRAFFIYPFNDSIEYVCAEDGFYRVDNTVRNIQRLKDGLFWFMFSHKDGNLILSADNRLYVFQAPEQFTGIEKVYPELDSISYGNINSAVNWNDSLLFLGSEQGKGVYEWDYKKRILAKLESKSSIPLKDSIVNAIYKDKKNRIWILSDNSFAVFSPPDGKLENYKLANPVTAKPLTLFFDMCEVSGYYWLASYGSGLIQLDDQFHVKKIISTNEGMNNAGVYKIFPLNDSLLLITSNNGLSKINIRDSSISNYFESDGLHSNAFEELCGTVYKGKIYAGGPDGFTIIDPKFITTNTIAPELYINNIIVETNAGHQDTSNLFFKTVKLPGNLLQATVYFSALNFSNPERVTYKYRIKEQQNEWIKLSTQNFVNLIGLKPGDYTLQVQAFNEDGIASEIKKIQLIFLPKWYQTWWFKILLAVLVTAIVYGIYKVRINQLKKEKEIRTHLASDLHDDLGSTLNSVKVYANMAMIEKENTIYLERVKESAQEAISGIRDIIWILDDKKDNLDHLITRVSLFAAPLCDAGRISFHCHQSDSVHNYKLEKEEKRNLYMIIKEAVNNSIKYANADSLHLIVENAESRLKIKIADNGIGFDKEKTNEGNGLKNMMSRSHQIGYRTTIITAPGQGTVVQLEKQ